MNSKFKEGAKPWTSIKAGIQKDKEGYTKKLNPVLWLLLKKLIEHHASYGQGSQAKSLNLTNMPMVAVVDYLEKYLKEELGLEGQARQSFLQRFRRFIWNGEVFRFQKADLDLLCQVIPQIGAFKSWEEFSSKYSGNKLVMDADKLTFEEFPYLSTEDRHKVVAAASFLYGASYVQADLV